MASQTPEKLTALFAGIRVETPDWRDESAYPVPGETTMEEWAAQFALRNPSVRQRWADAMATRDAKPELQNASMLNIAMDDGGGASVERFEPDAFGVSRAPMNYDHLSKSKQPGMGRPTHPRQLDIRFNLEAPIKAQIEEAEAIFNRFKSALKQNGKIEPWDTKINERLFPLYLRQLDAETAGAARDEVIQVFQVDYPDIYNQPRRRGQTPINKQYSNNLNAAKKLRDGGFEKILWGGGVVD